MYNPAQQWSVQQQVIYNQVINTFVCPSTRDKDNPIYLGALDADITDLVADVPGPLTYGEQGGVGWRWKPNEHLHLLQRFIRCSRLPVMFGHQ